MIESVFFLFIAGLPDIPRQDCIEAEFVQERRIEALERTLLLKGALRVEREGFLFWHVREPYSYSYRLSHDVIEEIMPDGSRRELALDQAPWLMTTSKLMTALLAGEMNELEEYFEIHEIPGEHNRKSIRLLPHDQALAEAVTSMEMSWSTWPTSLQITTADGNSSTISFRDVKTCADSGDEE